MKKLYKNLMNLVGSDNTSAKFFYKDVITTLGTKARIFGYHYASYEDWLKPDALESRGIMFEINDKNEPVRIMCRPMQKFFNLNELPLTMDLDLSSIDYYMTKADGSLISTYHDNGILQVKSKGSIFSDQSREAYQFLLRYDEKSLYDRCLELALAGFTCNFEYVAPTNRIVLHYDKSDLILLNVRNNETGEYVEYSEIKKDPILRKYLVDAFVPEDGIDMDEHIEDIRNMQDIEGYVFQLEDGTIFKLKTVWYSDLHRVKSSISNNSDLFKAVASGTSDDLKSLFTGDDYSITKIIKFESIFLEYLQSAIDELKFFHDKWRGYDRKTYAIEGQTYFKSINKLELFSIVMCLYEGRYTTDETIDHIAQVFVKYSEAYVPSEYNKIINIEE